MQIRQLKLVKFVKICGLDQCFSNKNITPTFISDFNRLERNGMRCSIMKICASSLVDAAANNNRSTEKDIK